MPGLRGANVRWERMRPYRDDLEGERMPWFAERFTFETARCARCRTMLRFEKALPAPRVDL